MTRNFELLNMNKQTPSGFIWICRPKQKPSGYWPSKMQNVTARLALGGTDWSTKSSGERLDEEERGRESYLAASESAGAANPRRAPAPAPGPASPSPSSNPRRGSRRAFASSLLPPLETPTSSSPSRLCRRDLLLSVSSPFPLCWWSMGYPRGGRYEASYA
jgi:hypothetical protein